MKFVIPALSLFALMILTGCGDPAKKGTGKGDAKGDPAKDPAKNDPAKPAKIELVPAKFAKVESDIAELKGKVVVVDVWATWCVPCVKEFPNLVKLHEAQAKNGVVCMSISLDDPGDKADALKFLTGKNATFANYLLDDQDAAQSKWGFKSIPTAVVYGRDGKIAKIFKRDDKETFTYEDVGSLVSELIK